jgi:hypothetical protein
LIERSKRILHGRAGVVGHGRLLHWCTRRPPSGWSGVKIGFGLAKYSRSIEKQLVSGLTTVTGGQRVNPPCAHRGQCLALASRPQAEPAEVDHRRLHAEELGCRDPRTTRPLLTEEGLRETVG